MDILKNLNILLLEDNKEFAKNTIEFLELYFNKIFHSISINGALKLYDKNSIDIIISDIKVADGNGLDFITVIRDKNKEIPIVILSAHKDEDFLFKAIPLNICSYELKPIQYNDFLSLLTSLSSKFNKNITIFVYKNLVYNFKTKLLLVDNKIVKLTRNEVLFIELLICNQIVTNDMIQEYVYKEKMMSDSSIKNLILRLRKKVNTELIYTITGIGYKIVY